MSLTIVFDWGFTRLKAWLLDDKGYLVHEDSVLTSELAANPAYYQDDDLEVVSNWLLRFISLIPPATQLDIYLSSQMHSIAGAFTNGKKFFSTWQDLPLYPQVKDNSSFDGVPNLLSMPIYKLINNCHHLHLSTLNTKEHESITSLSYASSPLTLLLSKIFDVPLPCSPSWWHSTCLSAETSELTCSTTTYLDDKPVTFLHREDSLVTIYPEIGDLQASTHIAAQKHDIIINLGTGSQVICTDSKLLELSEYFRIWPNSSIKPIVISHVPCGRLLSDYAFIKGITLDDLRKTFVELTLPEITCDSQLFRSLLYFPGYCTHNRAYFQEPLITKSDLSSLSPPQLLALWVNQYTSILTDMSSCIRNQNLCVGVTGSLGGFALPLVAKLDKILPPSFHISQESTSLPDSIVSMFLN